MGPIGQILSHPGTPLPAGGALGGLLASLWKPLSESVDPASCGSAVGRLVTGCKDYIGADLGLVQVGPMSEESWLILLTVIGLGIGAAVTTWNTTSRSPSTR